MSQDKQNPKQNPNLAPTYRLTPPTMKEVMNWIKSLGLEPDVEEALMKKAKKYPINAMHRFREKISHHIKEIQKNNLKKLLDKEEN